MTKHDATTGTEHEDHAGSRYAQSLPTGRRDRYRTGVMTGGNSDRQIAQAEVPALTMEHTPHETVCSGAGLRRRLRATRPDPSALSAIAYARRRNVIVMLVTGRILDDLRRVAGELRFVDGVVAENGAGSGLSSGP